MLTPPLHALDARNLRPPDATPTDAPAYAGAPWYLQFTEQEVPLRSGRRKVCVIIKLYNETPGHANARDGSQYELADAITAAFGPVFAKDADRLNWEYDTENARRPWRKVCDMKTMSFGRWKFDALLPVGASKKQRSLNSWIPGGSTREFLGLAFDMSMRYLPIELAGKEYTWKEKNDGGNQEGTRVTWMLTEPEGGQRYLGGARRLLSGEPRGGGGY